MAQHDKLKPEDMLITDTVIESGYSIKVSDPPRNYIIVRSKRFGLFTWPRFVDFDGQTWMFHQQDAMGLDEASDFGGKAQYVKITPGTDTVEENEPADEPDEEPETNNETSYWVVGAKYQQIGGDYEDMLPEFVKRGYWELGWDRGDKPWMDDLFDKIRVGDRIAIKTKRWAATHMSIRAIGIVTDLLPCRRRVAVRWISTEDGQHSTICHGIRMAPIAGCMASIHGPFLDSTFTSQIFHI